MLPVGDVVKQGRACVVAAHAQNEGAVRTGDGFGRHRTRPRASWRTARDAILKREMSRIPVLGEEWLMKSLDLGEARERAVQRSLVRSLLSAGGGELPTGGSAFVRCGPGRGLHHPSGF